MERCHKRAKTRNRDADWATYRRTRNSYIQNCRDRESEYDNGQLEELSLSDFKTKHCWKLYRSILGIGKDQTCPPLTANGITVSDSKMKATIFNDIFISKSEIDDSGIIPPDDNSLQNIANDQLNHIDITLQQGRIQDFFPGGVRWETVPQRRRRRLSGRYGGGFGGPPPRKFGI